MPWSERKYDVIKLQDYLLFLIFLKYKTELTKKIKMTMIFFLISGVGWSSSVAPMGTTRIVVFPWGWILLHRDSRHDCDEDFDVKLWSIFIFVIIRPSQLFQSFQHCVRAEC